MSKQYDEYLQQHKANVKKGYDWIKDNLPELIPDGRRLDLEHQIGFAHDYSKSRQDEYEPYDAYFYGGNRSYQVVKDYEYAWLLHIHRNPHHWQHWVLIHDDPDEAETILDMPYEYILEMICDWWAFSWSKENLYEIFNWYDEHKNYMKLSDKTRKTVEDIFSKMHDKLDEEEIQHSGVKGMKWGVKNGPPYPIKEHSSSKKTDNHDNIVEEAIKSGSVSKTVNKEKQKRHTMSDHIPGRSYLYGDLDYAQRLVDKHSGKGIPLLDKNGNWLQKEKFTDTKAIGVHLDINGKEVETDAGMIVYSKTGTHVYPRKEIK